MSSALPKFPRILCTLHSSSGQLRRLLPPSFAPELPPTSPQRALTMGSPHKQKDYCRERDEGEEGGEEGEEEEEEVEGAGPRVGKKMANRGE